MSSCGSFADGQQADAPAHQVDVPERQAGVLASGRLPQRARSYWDSRRLVLTTLAGCGRGRYLADGTERVGGWKVYLDIETQSQ
jgi:hypothetical protein